MCDSIVGIHSRFKHYHLKTSSFIWSKWRKSRFSKFDFFPNQIKGFSTKWFVPTMKTCVWVHFSTVYKYPYLPFLDSKSYPPGGPKLLEKNTEKNFFSKIFTKYKICQFYILCVSTHKNIWTSILWYLPFKSPVWRFIFFSIEKRFPVRVFALKWHHIWAFQPSVCLLSSIMCCIGHVRVRV